MEITDFTYEELVKLVKVYQLVLKGLTGKVNTLTERNMALVAECLTLRGLAKATLETAAHGHSKDASLWGVN